MLYILAHSNLPHNTILISINTRQLSQMSIHVLQSIIELKSINISESILDITVNNQFNDSENLTNQMESITKTRFFTLFCCESLNGFQVKIVVQM